MTEDKLSHTSQIKMITTVLKSQHTREQGHSHIRKQTLKEEKQERREEDDALFTSWIQISTRLVVEKRLRSRVE